MQHNRKFEFFWEIYLNGRWNLSVEVRNQGQKLKALLKVTKVRKIKSMQHLQWCSWYYFPLFDVGGTSATLLPTLLLGSNEDHPTLESSCYTYWLVSTTQCSFHKDCLKYFIRVVVVILEYVNHNDDYCPPKDLFIGRVK